MNLSFSNVYRKLNTCNCCNKRQHITFLTIKDQPIQTSNNFSSSNKKYTNIFINLNLFLCKNCLNIQLKEAVNPKILYENFNYKTSITLGLVNHFKLLSKKIIKDFNLKEKDQILDIGSNDGSFLKNFLKYKIKVLGIDPAKKIAKKASANGIKTLPIYFNYKSSKKIKKEFGSFRIIASFNTFANIYKFRDFILGVKNLLSEDGTFILETQYGIDVIKKQLIDTVYHEHVNYFTVSSLQKLFNRFNLYVDDCQFLSNKGGSIRLFIKKKITKKNEIKIQNVIKKEKNFLKNSHMKNFTKNLNQIKIKLQNIIKKIKSSKKEKVYAFGSSVGSTTLINFLELSNYIDGIYDDKPITKNLYFKKNKITVKNSKILKNGSYIIILAWRYSKNIIKKHKLKKLKFISFLPKVKIIKNI